MYYAKNGGARKVKCKNDILRPSAPHSSVGFVCRKKKKRIALILCAAAFLGFGGLHRLYVGKVGSALFHLFTFGIFGIGTVIDIILIISGNFTDSYGQPLS